MNPTNHTPKEPAWAKVGRALGKMLGELLRKLRALIAPALPRMKEAAGKVGRSAAPMLARVATWWRVNRPLAKVSASGFRAMKWMGAALGVVGFILRGLGATFQRRWRRATPRWRAGVVVVAVVLLGLVVQNVASGMHQRSEARKAAEQAALADAARKADEATRRMAEEVAQKAIAANELQWQQRLAAVRASTEQAIEAERKRNQDALALERTRTQSAVSATEQKLLAERTRMEQALEAERRKTNEALAAERARPQPMASTPPRNPFSEPSSQKIEIKMATPPPRQEQCLACRGSGKLPCSKCKGAKTVSCEKCKGLGKVLEGVFTKTWEKCGKCDATGRVKCGWMLSWSGCNGSGTEDCPKCSGSGRVTLNN